MLFLVKWKSLWKVLQIIKLFTLGTRNSDRGSSALSHSVQVVVSCKTLCNYEFMSICFVL